MEILLSSLFGLQGLVVVDGLLDLLFDGWHNEIALVGHSALLDAGEGGLERGIENLLGGLSLNTGDFVEHGFGDLVENRLLVRHLVLLGLLQQVESSFVDVVLQGDLLVVEERLNHRVFDGVEAGVNLGVLELREGELDVLTGHDIEGLGVVFLQELHLVEEDELVPAVQDRTI